MLRWTASVPPSRHGLGPPRIRNSELLLPSDSFAMDVPGSLEVTGDWVPIDSAFESGVITASRFYAYFDLNMSALKYRQPRHSSQMFFRC